MPAGALWPLLLLLPAARAGPQAFVEPADIPGDVLPAALAAGDECLAAADGSSCALSALQRRGTATSAQSAPATLATTSEATSMQVPDYEEKLSGSCDDVLTMAECGQVAAALDSPSYEMTTCSSPNCAPRGCYQYHHGNANNLKVYYNSDKSGSCSSYRHCLCKRRSATVPAAPTVPADATGLSGWRANQALSAPSDAPLLTFYVYRVASDETYPPENVNAGSLAGIMWYLHNEVVYRTPRKFGITRILRLKVQTKASQPLYSKGMNFGVRYAFDRGMCTGPWSCDEQWNKYGFFVGCNNLGEFPFPTYRVHYTGGIWYSFPGKCPSKEFQDHTPACEQAQPGGACHGAPIGTGDCTYSYEMAGEVRLDELVGIGNYQFFKLFGGQEYDTHTDRGYLTNFWDGKFDDAACARRVRAAQLLFQRHYPNDPQDWDLPAPKCDFSQDDFYH